MWQYAKDKTRTITSVNHWFYQDSKATLCGIILPVETVLSPENEGQRRCKACIELLQKRGIEQ